MRRLIIADVHANLAAFEAVLAAAGHFDEIWCLGDVVGYGPEPNECIELLRQYKHVSVAGNHDWAVVGRIDISDFNPVAKASVRWTEAQLSPENHKYLERLPIMYRVGSVTLVHGSPRGPVWEYIDDSITAREIMLLMPSLHCFVGHTHVPVIFSERKGLFTRAKRTSVDGHDIFTELTEARLIINPGSVGQPRDGDPRAAYIIYDNETGVAESHRVEYQLSRTQEHMLTAGLPAQNASRLALGR